MLGARFVHALRRSRETTSSWLWLGGKVIKKVWQLRKVVASKWVVVSKTEASRLLLQVAAAPLPRGERAKNITWRAWEEYENGASDAARGRENKRWNYIFLGRHSKREGGKAAGIKLIFSKHGCNTPSWIMNHSRTIQSAPFPRAQKPKLKYREKKADVI